MMLGFFRRDKTASEYIELMVMYLNSYLIYEEVNICLK